MRVVEFTNENFYHVYNRGVEKRTLFKDRADFQRFYNAMYLFNNLHVANPGGNAPPSSLRDEDIERLLKTEGPRKPFVRVISFCLLSNHFHFFLEQLLDDGISRFLHRLSMGYARYFNKRYERTGRLYEGTFKAVMVQRDSQFDHLPRYIHLNALDGTHHAWREGSLSQWGRAQKFLDEYPWSSHHVYSGRPQSLPLVDEQFVRRLFPNPTHYLKFLRQWSVRSFNSFVS